MKLVPVATDAWRFVIPAALIGGGLMTVGEWWATSIGTLFLLLAVCTLGFFRDWDRETPADDSLIYSPADGKIVEVGLWQRGEYTGWKVVRIFLSVLDGHVQRCPVKGGVKKVVYTKGRFLDARHPEAHFENEQNSLTIVGARGTLVVTQIAGLIARRIVCWVKEGAQLEQGERFGLIRFGSQVDVLLPQSAQIVVKTGDRVVGGRTVLAHWAK